MTALFEAGPSEYHATGTEVGLGWATLVAYAQATEAISEPWEFRALIALSAEYVRGKLEGADPFCRPPTDQDDMSEG